MSDGLLGVLRLLRALDEAGIAARAELRAEGERLSLRYVEEIEAAGGVAFPFDVLALATLNVPLLVHACGLMASRLAGPNWDCAGPIRVPSGWVALATFGGEGAMREKGALGPLGTSSALAIARLAPRDKEPQVRVATADGAEPAVALSAFLKQQIARRWGTTPRFAEVVESARTDDRPLEPSHVATLVDDREKARPAVRVSHTKFGLGTISAYLEGDKVEVTFDSGETKRLARSFVRDA